MAAIAGTADQANLPKIGSAIGRSKRKGPRSLLGRGPCQCQSAKRDRSVPVVAHDAEQEQEDVDEVEIEAQRTHYGVLGEHVGAERVRIALLDLLRIPRGETYEDQHADDR